MEFNNKRIAKNSIFLYIRMLFNMVITFYTSRIVLEVLGVEDFGIYGVIGGVVALFSFLNGCMASATSRFLTFELGKGEFIQLKKVFSAALTIHIIIAIIVLICAEILGIWWIGNKLVISPERMDAAYWVFQFSLLISVINIIQVPYNAAIIAHEKMNVYALVEIFNSLLKLAIVYWLVGISFDKLIIYAALMLGVTVIITTIYKIYCLMHFPETHYEFHKDKDIIKPMLAFSGWELFGAFANVIKSQGNNILLNMFFGVTLNAAYSISNQVYGAVGQFVNSFQTAVNPQIIKSYACGEKRQYFTLVYKSSRLSYLLMLIPIAPIIYNVDYILTLWLGNPPIYTGIFIILILVDTMINTLSGPLIIATKAIGRIKYYQIVISILLIMNLPFTYCFFLKHEKPFVMFLVGVFFSFLTLIYRVYFLRKVIRMPLKEYWNETFCRILISTIVLFFILYWMHSYYGVASIFFMFLVQSFCVVFVTLLIIYYIGLFPSERFLVRNMIRCWFVK